MDNNQKEHIKKTLDNIVVFLLKQNAKKVKTDETKGMAGRAFDWVVTKMLEYVREGEVDYGKVLENEDRDDVLNKLYAYLLSEYIEIKETFTDNNIEKQITDFEKQITDLYIINLVKNYSYLVDLLKTITQKPKLEIVNPHDPDFKGDPFDYLLTNLLYLLDNTESPFIKEELLLKSAYRQWAILEEKQQNNFKGSLMAYINDGYCAQFNSFSTLCENQVPVDRCEYNDGVLGGSETRPQTCQINDTYINSLLKDVYGDLFELKESESWLHGVRRYYLVPTEIKEANSGSILSIKEKIKRKAKTMKKDELLNAVRDIKYRHGDLALFIPKNIVALSKEQLLEIFLTNMLYITLTLSLGSGILKANLSEDTVKKISVSLSGPGRGRPDEIAAVMSNFLTKKGAEKIKEEETKSRPKFTAKSVMPLITIIGVLMLASLMPVAGAVMLAPESGTAIASTPTLGSRPHAMTPYHIGPAAKGAYAKAQQAFNKWFNIPPPIASPLTSTNKEDTHKKLPLRYGVEIKTVEEEEFPEADPNKLPETTSHSDSPAGHGVEIKTVEEEEFPEADPNKLPETTSHSAPTTGRPTADVYEKTTMASSPPKKALPLDPDIMLQPAQPISRPTADVYEKTTMASSPPKKALPLDPDIMLQPAQPISRPIADVYEKTTMASPPPKKALPLDPDIMLQPAEPISRPTADVYEKTTMASPPPKKALPLPETPGGKWGATLGIGLLTALTAPFIGPKTKIKMETKNRNNSCIGWDPENGEPKNGFPVIKTYYRDRELEESKVVMRGMVYGESTSEVAKLVHEYFPDSGVASLVKLLRHPILGQPGGLVQAVRDKLHQFIHFTDKIIKDTIPNKKESVRLGLSLYSPYNNQLMLILVGVDAYVFSDDPNFNPVILTNKDLIGVGADIKNSDIFSQFHLQPGYRYRVVITTNGKERMHQEELRKTAIMNHLIHNCDYVFNTSFFLRKLSVETQNKVLIAEFVPILPRHDQIRNRKKQIEAAIKDVTYKPRPVKFPCVWSPVLACVYEISPEQLGQIRKKIGGRITVYGTTGTSRDSLEGSNVTKQIVKNAIEDKIGVYQTFELLDNMIPNTVSIKNGQIIIFVTESEIAFFMKIKERKMDLASLMIELQPVTNSTANKEIKLSFPDLKKTYKLNTSKLDANKLRKCKQMIGSSFELNKHKLMKDYTELTQAYVGIVTGKTKVGNINVFEDTTEEMVEKLKSVHSFKKLADLLGQSEETPEEMSKHLSETSSETESISETSSDETIEIPREEATSALVNKKYTKLLFILAALGGGLLATELASRYFTGSGMAEHFASFMGWKLQVEQAAEQVATVVNKIAIGQAKHISELEPEKVVDFVQRTLEQTINASPDVAKAVLENKANGYGMLASAFEKISTLISDNTSEGIRFIGAGGEITGALQPGVAGTAIQTIQSGLTGPLNQSQSAVLSILERIAGSGSTVEYDSLFEIAIEGGKTVTLSASQIFSLTVNDAGQNIHEVVPDVLRSIANGYGPALECLQTHITATGMPTSSINCAKLITDAFATEDKQIASLGSRMWSVVSGVSYTQIALTLGIAAATTAAIVVATTGVGAVGVGAAGVGMVNPQFAEQAAAFAAPAIHALRDRVGVHELMDLFRNAIDPGTVQQLGQQIIGHSAVETAQQLVPEVAQRLAGI